MAWPCDHSTLSFCWWNDTLFDIFHGFSGIYEFLLNVILENATSGGIDDAKAHAWSAAEHFPDVRESCSCFGAGRVIRKYGDGVAFILKLSAVVGPWWPMSKWKKQRLVFPSNTCQYAIIMWIKGNLKRYIFAEQYIYNQMHWNVKWHYFTIYEACNVCILTSSEFEWRDFMS